MPTKPFFRPAGANLWVMGYSPPKQPEIVLSGSHMVAMAFFA
jgi:hypothetical protein